MSKTYQEQYLDGERKTIPVEYAHIISNYSPIMKKAYGSTVYYQIKYKPIDEDEIHIGFGSYYFNLVLGWMKECFEIVNVDSETCEGKE